MRPQTATQAYLEPGPGSSGECIERVVTAELLTKSGITLQIRPAENGHILEIHDLGGSSFYIAQSESGIVTLIERYLLARAQDIADLVAKEKK